MTSEDAATPRFCQHCGATVDAGLKFCTTCGGGLTPDAIAEAHHALTCEMCGGQGARLPADKPYCPWCRWLRPLGPDYEMPVEAFIWSLDAEAMAVLRSIGPLNQAAHQLSDRIGGPWLEQAVNGVRLGPDQLPEIFEPAIRAARIIGLPYLPEIYVSGEQMWEAHTLGTDANAFIVLGSVLTNMKGDDMLYVLGREMGHVAAGHAVWKTVSQFLGGKKQQTRSVMGDGVMQFLNPLKIVEGAIDAPLVAWARHAEITGDRAGAMVVGREDVARRVTTQWALKSFPLYARLNQQALERQIDDADTRQTQVSEWMMSATPYLSRRLKFMRDWFESEEFVGWRAVIDHWDQAGHGEEPPAAPTEGRSAPLADQDVVRIKCVSCGEPLRFPRGAMEGKESVRIRCANPACGQVMEVKPKAAEAPAPPPADNDTVRLICLACEQPMRVPRSVFEGVSEAHVRCPNPACRQVMTVKTDGKAQPPDVLSEG